MRRCLPPHSPPIHTNLTNACTHVLAHASDNAAFYAANGIPFVMGTTGGDQARLLETARNGGVYAVIAPQMGKQVRGSGGVAAGGLGRV